MKIPDGPACFFRPAASQKQASAACSRVILRFAALAAGLALASGSLEAQVVWAPVNGSGSLDDAANWTGGSLPTGQVASFTSTTFTPNQVQLQSSDLSVGGISLGSGAGVLTFTSPGSGGAKTLTIGSSGIVNSSSNTLTFDVTSKINLLLSSNATFTANGPIVIQDDSSGGGASGFSIGANTLTLSGTSTGASIGKGLTGSGSVVKSGTGTWTLNGANSYAGGTTLSSGTLKLGNANALGTGTLTTANGVTLANSSGSSLTVGNNLNVSGSLLLGTTKTDGDLVLSGSITPGDSASTIGSFARATLSGPIGSLDGLSYKFGGGDGTLVVSSNLGAVGGAGLSVISSTSTSGEDDHLTVYLKGTNTFTGNVSVTASSLILDSANALPSGVGVRLSDDGYVGYTENSFSSFANFKTAITTSNSTLGVDTIIGIDSANPASPRTVSDAIDLTNISAYLGTATNVTLNGPISYGSSSALALTGVNGGYLKVSSPLTTSGNITSVKIGNSENEPFDVTYKGYVELTGANSYTGGTTLKSGYLLVGNNSALGSGALTVTGSADTGAPALAASANGVTLANDINLTVNSGNNTTSDNKLVIGVPTTSNTTDFAYPLQSLASNNLTLTGNITGTNALSYVGSGTLTLSGNNTYTGATTINSGTVVANNTVGSATGSGTITIAGGATLQVGTGSTAGAVAGNIVNNGAVIYNRSNDATYDGVISGTGTGTKLGAGTLTLTGTNTFTGTIAINAGQLSIGSDANLGASTSTLALNNGVLATTATMTLASTRSITLGTLGSGNGFSPASGTTLTFDGVISGNGGLTKYDSGTLSLGGANTFAGLTIGSGRVKLTGNTAAGAGKLTFTGSNTYAEFSTTSPVLNGLESSAATSGEVQLTSPFSPRLTINQNFDSTFYGNLRGDSGNDSNTDGVFVKTGTGTLTLSGGWNYGHYGQGSTHDVLEVQQGTLALDGFKFEGTTTAVKINGGTLSVASGTTLNNPVIAASNSGTLTGNGAVNGAVTLDAGLTVAPSSGTLSVSGNIGGSGALTKSGAGTLTLSGTNTYSGDTSVSAGSLILANASGSGTGTGNVTVSTGANLLVGTGTAAGALTGNISNSGNVTFSRSDASTYAGVLSAFGQVNKTGTGTLTLSGANTYTGVTNVTGGTLAISQETNLGAGPNVFNPSSLTLNGGALENTASLTLNSNRGVTLSGTGGTFNTDASTILTVSGNVTGGAGLTKSGTGTLVLAGANSYNGTTINAGELQLASTGTLSAGADITLSGSGVFRTLAGNQTIRDLIGSSPTSSVIIESGATLTSNMPSTNPGNLSTYAGLITGAGSFVKNGPGTLILTGSSGLSGLTTVSSGTLQIGNNGTAGSITGNISTGNTTTGVGTIDFYRSDPATYAGVISGNGTIAKDGFSTLTISGNANTFNGTLKVNAGTLTFTGANSGSPNLTANVTSGAVLDLQNNLTLASVTGAGTTQIASGKTLTFGQGGPLTSVISGAGNVAINGVVTVTANQTYTGTTTLLDNGTNLTLNLGNNTASGMVAGNIVATTSKTGVQFNRSDAVTYGGVISGGGFVNKNNTNTLTLTGQSTYTGGTTVGAGTLVIGTTNALPTTTSLGIGSNATLDVAFDQSIAGFLSNASNSTIQIASGKTLKVSLGNSPFGSFYNGLVTGAGTFRVGPSTSSDGGHTIGLNNDNTYTGGTIIEAGGKLLLGNNGSTGSILGNVTNDGVLIFNRGTKLTFGGVISGTGSVSQGSQSGTTTGDTVLTGENTYTGGTSVYSKALIVGDGGTTGSIVGNVSLFNEATLALNRSNDTSFAGVVSGTGSFFKAGTGTLTLTGQNTYTGNTFVGNSTVSGGTLVLGVTNALPTTTQLAIAASAMLDVEFNQTIAGFFNAGELSSILHLDTGTTFTVAMPVANTSTTFAGTVNGEGTFAVSGAGGDVVNLTGSVASTVGTSVGSGATLNVATGGAIAGPISLGSGSSFTLGSSGTQTFANVISGAGSIVASAGTTTLSAPNTYTGGTTINGGKIIVSNSSGSATGSGPVNVGTGGILGGSGIITGPLTLNDGATVAPGNSPGLLTVGSTTFASGATFAFDINSTTGTPGTNWDILNITGPLTISATVANPFIINLVSLDSANTAGLLTNFDPMQPYAWQFVTTTGGITGFSAGAFQYNASQFQNALNGGFFFVSQSANNLVLNFSPVPEPSTWALLAAGLGALGFIALRRRRKA